TITIPPRPPSRGDRVGDEEFEAIVEALIKEARQRARRRRSRYAAVATLLALLGVGLFAVIDRGTRTVDASSKGSGRSSLVAGTADARIAYVAAKRNAKGGYEYVNDLFVLDPDQGGRQLLARDAGVGRLAWSLNGRKLAFIGLPVGLGDVYV